MLTQRFYRYTMSITDIVLQRIAEVQKLVGYLLDLNENVSNEAMIVKILARLNSKFNPIRLPSQSAKQSLVERVKVQGEINNLLSALKSS